MRCCSDSLTNKKFLRIASHDQPNQEPFQLMPLPLALNPAQALGQHPPNNACFVLCGQDCMDLHARLRPLISDMIASYEEGTELRQQVADGDGTSNHAKKKAR